MIEVSVAAVLVVPGNWITAAHGCFLYTILNAKFRITLPSEDT
jgi:hypothetical protein